MRQVADYYVAPTAIITADVRIGRGVNLWYGAVVRGDVAPIILGDCVNIQDCAVVHCDYGVPNELESGVVVGHAAVIHGRRVGSDTLVGIGAKLLSETEIGPECVIAAGAVVPPGMIVPPRSLLMGIPARIVRSATPEEIAKTRTISQRYRELAEQYAAGQMRVITGGHDE